MRAVLLCWMLLCLPVRAEVWRVIGDEQFIPYSFMQHNEPAGLDVELIRAILAEAGIGHSLQLYPWERVKLLMAHGGAELAFQFAGTPERQQQYALAGPLRSGDTVFMTRNDSPLHNWQQLTDLAPYVIGQVKGYAYEAAFDHAPLTRDCSAHNPEQLLAMLRAGRVDVIVGDRLQLQYLVQQQPAGAAVRILPRPLIRMPRYVAFAKGDTARARLFASALQKLQRTHQLDAIYRRWGATPPAASAQ